MILFRQFDYFDLSYLATGGYERVRIQYQVPYLYPVDTVYVHRYAGGCVENESSLAPTTAYAVRNTRSLTQTILIPLTADGVCIPLHLC